MKGKLLIIFCGIFFAITGLKAQRALYKPQAHEFSFQLGAADAVLPFASEGTYSGQLPFAVQALNGFRYTYHHSLSDGFRLSFYNRKASLQEEGQGEIGIRREYQLQLGYERKYHSGPHQWAGGPEVFFNVGNTEYPNPPASPPDPFSFQSWGGALSGSYAYFINTHLSLGLEASLYYARPSYVSGVSNQNEFPSYIFQENILGATAGIWLNAHLVKMKKRCTCPRARR